MYSLDISRGDLSLGLILAKVLRWNSSGFGGSTQRRENPSSAGADRGLLSVAGRTALRLRNISPVGPFPGMCDSAGQQIELLRRPDRSIGGCQREPTETTYRKEELSRSTQKGHLSNVNARSPSCRDSQHHKHPAWEGLIVPAIHVNHLVVER